MLNNVLQVGDIGDNVKILQEKLKILGFYHPIITGSFGLSTEVGVKAFQREYNLEETGVVDEETWNLLFRLTEKSTRSRIAPIITLPSLSLGSTGDAVLELQTKLKALLYYTGKITGTFDLETENAVKRLQYNNDITTTGVVNSTTWNVINSLYGNLASCVTENVVEGNSSYFNYTVERGDTLYAIARRFDTTVDEIKRINNLTSNTLTIGQVLRIPTEEDESYTTYTVKRGDTLYAIASRYDTTVDEIKRINNLTSNTLTIGQILKIPTMNDTVDYISYVVTSGDTLYAIARRYNTTVDAIKSLNNLTSNILAVGQVLRIPANDVEDYINYTVKRGDRVFMGNKG